MNWQKLALMLLIMLIASGCRNRCNSCREGERGRDRDLPYERDTIPPRSDIPIVPSDSRVAPPTTLPDSRDTFRDPLIWPPSETKKEVLYPESPPPKSSIPPFVPSEGSSSKIEPRPLLEAPVVPEESQHTMKPSNTPDPRVLIPPPLLDVEKQPSRPITQNDSPNAVGLKNFVKISEHWATGGKPDLDGFYWLKAQGFARLIYVHGANEDYSAVKLLAENRGLVFTSLSFSEKTLGSLAEKFAQLRKAYPTEKVYLASELSKHRAALWYVYGRKFESWTALRASDWVEKIGWTDRAEDPLWKSLNEEGQP